MIDWSQWRLEQPAWLLLLIGIPLVARLQNRHRFGIPPLRYASIEGLQGVSASWRERLANLPRHLRAAALAILTIALAGPQSGRGQVQLQGEGIHIVLTLDISGSMRITDDPSGKAPNRLEDAKAVLRKFVAGRNGDPIGLVVFSGVPYTVSPMTLDGDLLDRFLSELQIDTESQTTAIGMALAASINRLRKSRSPSKVIVLVTDGDNNAGAIEPLTAAELASSMGIKVYTVGIGNPEGGFIREEGFFGTSQWRRVESNLNEPMLREVAEKTGGRFFRASQPGSLAEIFSTIDRLEKFEYDVVEFTQYQAHFSAAIAVGLTLLLLERLLAATWLRRLP